MAERERALVQAIIGSNEVNASARRCRIGRVIEKRNGDQWIVKCFQA